MAQTPLVFGSSQDRPRKRWCVWFVDVATGDVVPLAEYPERSKSDTAAFELAHASGSLEDPKVSDSILNGKSPEVAVLEPQLRLLIWTLASQAVKESAAPSGKQTAVSVFKRADDTVYVVRPSVVG